MAMIVFIIATRMKIVLILRNVLPFGDLSMEELGFFKNFLVKQRLAVQLYG